MKTTTKSPSTAHALRTAAEKERDAFRSRDLLSRRTPSSSAPSPQRSLDDQILDVVRGSASGTASRADVMAIDSIRHMTWSTVNGALQALCKRGVLIESKSGWRLAGGRA